MASFVSNSLALAPHSTEPSPIERRRFERLSIELAGRYMLSDGSEFSCVTVDISPGGISIRGPRTGQHGERVIAYIQNFGRIEGFIKRRARGWFAMVIRASDNKRARLTERLEWLDKYRNNETLDRRADERVEVDQVTTILRLRDGSEFNAELIDVSLAGATVNVNAAPPVGAQVMLGQQPAVVARLFEGGLALVFELDNE